MFKVEKKFIVNSEQKKELLKGAEFLHEKTFKETYYDNKQFSLASNDMWLYKLENEFILKIPTIQKEVGDHLYQEIVGEMAIREIFAVPVIDSFENDLKSNGHIPFCSLKTTKRDYGKNEFVIRIEEVNYGEWINEIIEIGLVVMSEIEKGIALNKISDFASYYGLEICSGEEKAAEYIKRKKPESYQASFQNGNNV